MQKTIEFRSFAVIYVLHAFYPSRIAFLENVKNVFQEKLQIQQLLFLFFLKRLLQEKKESLPVKRNSSVLPETFSHRCKAMLLEGHVW